MDNKIETRDRSESEIAGYRDVLSTIHSAFDAIPVKSSVLLQLHRDLYKYSSAKGGNYKSTNNVIEEILSNGTKYIRFKPVAAFILDFLCIHPFNDGNGRNSKWKKL